MNKTDRRFLTEYFGECWHDRKGTHEDGTVTRGYCPHCSKCGQYDPVNRTFDKPEDINWLIDNMVSQLANPHEGDFEAYLGKRKSLAKWWRLPAETQCQLICDFLRERRTITEDYYVSSPEKGTGCVTLDEAKVIVDAPPIWKRFIGQPSYRLTKWLGNGIVIKKLDKSRKDSNRRGQTHQTGVGTSEIQVG